MRTTRIACAVALLGFALGACSSAQHATSPLVGSWKINGDTPAPLPDKPQFVRLTFKADGSLEASYVAAGGALAGVVKTPSKLKTEHDSYTLDADKRVSIVEGSRALDYTYEVRDGKLFLTPQSQSDAIVYVKDDA